MEACGHSLESPGRGGVGFVSQHCRIARSLESKETLGLIQSDSGDKEMELGGGER